MGRRVHLTTWIDCDSKEHFARVAQAQGLTEPALLRRLIESSLLRTAFVDTQTVSPVEAVAATGRISVRLRYDDLVFLRERSRARELRTSTYVSYLVRAHLRAQTPLPTAELEALKRSVAEVGAETRSKVVEGWYALGQRFHEER
jgi:hypothetical protein